jgi:hypothetical protein
VQAGIFLTKKIKKRRQKFAFYMLKKLRIREINYWKNAIFKPNFPKNQSPDSSFSQVFSLEKQLPDAAARQPFRGLKTIFTRSLQKKGLRVRITINTTSLLTADGRGFCRRDGRETKVKIQFCAAKRYFYRAGRISVEQRADA